MGLFYAAPKAAPIKSALKAALIFVSMGLFYAAPKAAPINSFLSMGSIPRVFYATPIIAFCKLISLYVVKLKAKRRHRFWVYDILKYTKVHGAFMVRELKLDTDRYREYFRMSTQ